MNIFESIKEEKKLSLNHWRYRLLHWCFGIKAIKPEDSPLYKGLYTHYCPLFHLTNLIAIFIIPIFFVRLATYVIVALANFIFDMMDKCRPSLEEQMDASEIACEKAKRKKLLANFYGLAAIADRDKGFDHFWELHSKLFYGHFTYQELEEKYLVFIKEYDEKMARTKARKKRFRDQLIFWTNFSRVFIKSILNIGYFLLAGFVIYLLVCGIPLLIDLFMFLASWDVWSFAAFMGRGLFFVVIVPGVLVYFLSRRKWGEKCLDTCYEGVKVTLPPMRMMAAVIAAPVVWMWQFGDKVREFISVFYEENCPPIKIISEEEEIMENIDDRDLCH